MNRQQRVYSTLKPETSDQPDRETCALKLFIVKWTGSYW